MCHEKMRRAPRDNKKAPAKGLRSHTLSLEECEPAAAWAGVLTYGFGGRLQWRDRGRFSRPSPNSQTCKMSAVSLCAAARSVNCKPEGPFRIGCAGRGVPKFRTLPDSRQT